jgi:hypothetical protein
MDESESEVLKIEESESELELLCTDSTALVGSKNGAEIKETSLKFLCAIQPPPHPSNPCFDLNTLLTSFFNIIHIYFVLPSQIANQCLKLFLSHF